MQQLVRSWLNIERRNSKHCGLLGNKLCPRSVEKSYLEISAPGVGSCHVTSCPFHASRLDEHATEMLPKGPFPTQVNLAVQMFRMRGFPKHRARRKKQIPRVMKHVPGLVPSVSEGVGCMLFPCNESPPEALLAKISWADSWVQGETGESNPRLTA